MSVNPKKTLNHITGAVVSLKKCKRNTYQACSYVGATLAFMTWQLVYKHLLAAAGKDESGESEAKQYSCRPHNQNKELKDTKKAVR